jgi:hypothetical protein
MARAARTRSMPKDDDDQTRLELNAASSGREHELASGRPPATTEGSEVAPTARAEKRERERHRMERQIGRTAAGTKGVRRDTRRGPVTRQALAQAAREADRRGAKSGAKNR